MNADRQQAIDYLRAPAGGLWRWAESASVVVWRDGQTIAFREEIIQIIEWLGPNGLPPFGAIVFLLAACRGRVPKVSEVVFESKGGPSAGRLIDAALILTVRTRMQEQLEPALARLATVSNLPSELCSGIRARCVLAEAVFEPSRAERQTNPRPILGGLREPMDDGDLVDPERTAVSGNYIHQIHLVAEGLKPHTRESLSLRLRTGLDALPEELDAALPNAERARRLIDELSRDREYGALARAARDLMAAVRLPRRLGEQETLAIGGVADITNRGPLDRLLISELAHDDLTLAVRVALNEALYLRREPPMREPPGTLALLIDSGVRLWGVPRVLATAVALALVACDKQHSQVLSWRAHGKKLEPVDLLARTGLTQHLAALETSAHAGESIPAFSAAVAPGIQNVSVLITHIDSLADPGLRAAVAENRESPTFIAAVNREGRFEMHALPLARRPPICEADLDLASVFDAKTGVPPIKAQIHPDLPAIFGLTPFPFLLPLSGRVDFWTEAADGFKYAILNDRRLVQFKDRSHGGRVLASDLPGGSTLWMECVEGTVHAVKIGSGQRPARLLSYSSSDGQLRVTDLVIGGEVKAVYRYGDAIIVIRGYDVRACALSDGRLLGKAMTPTLAWANGRFFRNAGGFQFAVWDGERIKFEPVSLPTLILHSSISTIFDRPGKEGPWILLNSGKLISTESGEKIQVPPVLSHTLDLEATVVSKDGEHIRMPTLDASKLPDQPPTRVFSLKNLYQRIQVMGEVPGFNFDRPPALPIWSLRRVVEGIARLPDGIAFRGRKNRWWKLGKDHLGNLRIAESRGLENRNLTEHRVAEIPKKSRHGCLLYAADLSGENKAFFDSRGLLHLKSADPGVPEVSLVLADGEVAGWTADGYVCGPPFFFDGPYTPDPNRVFERIMQFLAGI